MQPRPPMAKFMEHSDSEVFAWVAIKKGRFVLCFLPTEIPDDLPSQK